MSELTIKVLAWLLCSEEKCPGVFETLLHIYDGAVNGWKQKNVPSYVC